MDHVVLVGVVRAEFFAAFKQQPPGTVESIEFNTIPSSPFRVEARARADERPDLPRPAVRRGEQHAPRLFGLRQGLAVTAAGVVRNPGFEFQLLGTRDKRAHEVIDHRVRAEPFHEESGAHEPAFVRTVPGAREPVVDLRQPAVEAHLVAEALDNRPAPVIPIECVCFLPGGPLLTPQVQHEHAASVHGAEQRSGLRWFPELGRVDEQPALHHPHRVGVGIRHGAVDRLAHGVEKRGVVVRRRHFDKRVGRVEMLGAEEPGLFFHEQGAHLAEKRVLRVHKDGRREIAPAGQRLKPRPGPFRGERPGHVSGEPLEHGRHPQFPFPRQDLLLQDRVFVYPGVRKRAAPAVVTAHPAERQVGGPHEEIRHVRIAEAEFLPHFAPHRLLAGHCQRHVDAMQRHPVNDTLPLGPVVPRHRIAEAAVVEAVTVAERDHHAHLGLHRRERFGQVKLRTVERHARVAAAEIFIEGETHGGTARTPQHHASVHRLDFVCVEPILWRDALNGKRACALRHHTGDEITPRAGRGLLRVGMDRE